MIWYVLPALAADPTWHALRSPAATSASYLKSNWNKFEENYHPTYVLDEDPKTAWVEGVDGDGVGQWLELPVSRVASARMVRVRIRNGYQRSESLLSANAAPKAVRLQLMDQGRVVTSVPAIFERKMGWQEAQIPVPSGNGFDAVRLVIDSVTPGRTYQDTCVSDLLVDVDSDVPYAPGPEAAKLATAKAWITSRVETAKQFAAGGFQSPFSETSYQCTNEDEPRRSAIEAALQPARPAGTVGAGAWRADPAAKFPEPEGSWDFERAAFLLRTDLAAFFESKDGKGRYEAPEAGNEEFWSGRQWTAFTLEGPPTAPTRGQAKTHEVFNERTTTVHDSVRTYTWENGLLKQLFIQNETREDGAHAGSEVLLVPTWKDRVIVSWEGWEKGRWVSECEGADCDYTRHWVCRGQ